MHTVSYHTTRSGLIVAEFGSADVLVREGADMRDLMLTAFERRPDWLALPATAFAPAFYDLKTGLAGDVLQRIVNWRQHVAILGDITSYSAKSEPLAALVREMNRGRDVWFLRDLAALLET